MASVGTTTTFTHTFTDLLGSVITPADATKWPAVIIRDESGQIIVNGGLATATANPGEYSYDYTVPISANEGEWSIEWQMVGSGNQQVQVTKDFDVEGAINAEDCGHEQTTIAKAGQTTRILYPSSVQLSEVKLEILDPTDCEEDEVVYYQADLVGDASTTPVTNILNESRDESGNWVYWTDVDLPADADTAAGHYMVNWEVRETVTSPLQYISAEIQIPPSWWWKMIPMLQSMLDKLQKSCDPCNIYAYGLSELYQASLRGLDFMNAWPPNGNQAWTIDNFASMCGVTCSRGRMQGAMYYWLVSATAIQALRAQYVMAGELAFDMSGQLVQLSSDKRDTYTEALNWLLEEWRENFVISKMTCIRNSNTIGHVAARPLDYQRRPQLTSRGGMSTAPRHVQSILSGLY